MHRVLAALMAVASCASIAQAQSLASQPAATTENVVTLNQALALAGTVSPSLDSAAAGVRAAQEARTVAGLRPNPSIVVESENLVGTGQYRGARSAETTAGVALPIELGGKRSARIGVANSQRNRADINSAIAMADLRLRVTQAYVEAAAAEQRLVIARDQTAIAENALKAARTRVTAGAGAPIDEQRADVLRVNAGVAEQKARLALDVARGNLVRLIGKPIDGALDLGWFRSVREGAYGPQMPVRADGTLALAAARADVDTASAQVRLARSQRVPDVTISASARRLAATNDTAAVVGLSIPFPLFNNGAAAERQAQAQRDQADAERRLANLNVEQDIAGAQADLQSAAASARAAGGPALTAAAEAARIARIGYAQGKFSQLDLLQAEQSLAETRAGYTDALSAYHDAEARLARLTSTPSDVAP
ncbi:TolC family protein [Sphingomonas oryzagri]|uniref:TolC family protein n=1 Tax=Sphingomonas oryzagri TaxID=3042314 RepID=A0ABT6N584_9SPHN|nr:TolC family protein [Sphingomonas oryzagri]MDH7640269.1 TolC family protein [Sphingomonas oryzagri]